MRERKASGLFASLRNAMTVCLGTIEGMPHKKRIVLPTHLISISLQGA